MTMLSSRRPIGTATIPRKQVSAKQAQSANDKDLERRVALFLCLRGAFREKAFRVRAENGTVTISGRLPSPQAKRLCLDCCRYVAGVIRVIDEMEVESNNKPAHSKPIEAFPRRHPNVNS